MSGTEIAYAVSGSTRQKQANLPAGHVTPFTLKLNASNCFAAPSQGCGCLYLISACDPKYCFGIRSA
eukprot:3869920-Rhodomonas_salina.2